MAPHFNFQTKQRPAVPVSKIMNTAFYGRSETMRTRNFAMFTVYAEMFGQFLADFQFFYSRTVK